MELHFCRLGVASALLAAGIGWNISVVCGEGPSHTNPNRGFGIWNTDGEAVELKAQAEKQYVEASKAVAPIVKQFEAGNTKSVRLQSVGEAHVKIRELFRLAAGLKQWAEPAGTEYQFRANDLHNRLKVAMQAIRNARSAEVQSLYEPMVNKATAGSKRILPTAKKYYEQQKYQECEATICKLYDELEIAGVWFDTFGEREAPFSALDTAISACGTKLQETRLAARKEAAAALQAKSQPNYPQVLQRIEDAAKSVGTTGQVTLGGQMISGPQAFAKYVGGLQRLRLGALNSAALFALDTTAEAKTSSAKALAEMVEFQKSVLPVLAKVVAADAERANEADASTLYSGYLAAIAPLSALYDEAVIKNTFASPLDQLKSKSQALSADAGSYQAATSDYLRWRARAAQAAARSKETKFPKLETHGLVEIELTGPGPKFLETATAQAVDHEVSVRDLRGSPTGESATTGHMNNVMVRTSVASQAAAAYNSLRADLLVTDALPPLSLDAALALESTRRGDLVAVGGKVSDVELQGTISLYAKLGMNDWGAAVEVLPENPFYISGIDPMKQVRLRVDIAPQWLQMKYAFVDLPVATK